VRVHANRAIVTEFARLFYEQRDVTSAFETFVVDDYLQHNPSMPDGRDRAIELLAPKFSTPGALFEVQRILVDGDFAVIHLKATFPGRPVAAVADIYRLRDGKIVEHWDVIQSMPDAVANDHPMF